MLKKVSTLTLALALAAPAFPMVKAAQVPKPTKLEQIYAATLAGSVAVAAVGYTYAHFKLKQAQAVRNFSDATYYGSMQQAVLGLPIAVAFAPVAAYICIAPFRGLYKSYTALRNVACHTSVTDITNSIQNLYGKFAK